MIDYAALARTTLPALLVERARRAPGAVAFRAKTRGVYRETTWRELADRVAAVALALQARGLRRGDTAAIMGNACPEWTIADLATQAAGGISALAVADGCPSLEAIAVIDTRTLFLYDGRALSRSHRGDVQRRRGAAHRRHPRGARDRGPLNRRQLLRGIPCDRR